MTAQNRKLPVPKVAEMNVALINQLQKFPKKVFDKGEEVIPRWRVSKNIFFIIKGKVISYFHDADIGEKDIAQGYFLNQDFINLPLLHSKASKHQYAIAVARTEVIVIPLIAFNRLMGTSTVLQNEVSKQLLKEIDTVVTKLHRRATMSSRKRIVKFLIDYTEDAGQQMGYEWLIRNRLSTTQIGQMANASRQTCSTLMNDLRRQNLIFYTRKNLIIRDLIGLRKLGNSLVFHHS